jgi:hypothetical protein
MFQNIVNGIPIRQGACQTSLVQNIAVHAQLPGGFTGKSISFVTMEVEKSLKVYAKVKVSVLNEKISSLVALKARGGEGGREASPL